jgi:hypothetical protein
VSLVPCWRRQAAGSARLEALQVCWSASRRPRPGSNSARVRWTEAPAAPLPAGSVIRTAEPPEPTLDCTSDRFRHSAHTKRHGPNHRRWPPGCSTVFDRSMSQNRCSACGAPGNKRDCHPRRVGRERGTRAQRSTNPVTLCDGYGAVGTGIGQIQMATETIRSARSEARTNDLDGGGRRMMSSEGGERDARGALPRRLHRARPVDLQITRIANTCLLVQARSQHDFVKSARRSGLDAARRHLLTATFR